LGGDGGESITGLPQVFVNAITKLVLLQNDPAWDGIKTAVEDIGSAFGRMYVELIIPIWKRALSILVELGNLELPKDFKIDTFFNQVRVVSPIAMTQQAEEVQRFMQSYQMVTMINPTLAATAYKVEDLPGWLTKMTGTPTTLLRSEAEAEQMQQIIAQFVAQQTQATAQPQGA
jgi:hypothetical protein